MFLQSAPARRAIPLRIAGGLGRALLGLACLALIATLLPSLFGYQRYVLVGHSMEPTIKRGSVIFDEVVPTPRLKVGDVITYVQPATRSPTTHRIVRRETSPDGRPVYITKGDNNAHEDLWPFTLDRPSQARAQGGGQALEVVVDRAGIARQPAVGALEPGQPPAAGLTHNTAFDPAGGGDGPEGCFVDEHGPTVGRAGAQSQ